MNVDLFLSYFNRISGAQDAVPRLRSFILDLAVRGKLVEQDPKDQPASKQIGNATPILFSEDDPAPFSIPAGWIWVGLGDICSKTGSGSTPRGGRAVYQSTGVPFLRSQNIYNDGLRLQDVAYIAEQTHERMSGTAVAPGDLLLNITGGSIGRCCLVPEVFAEANISQHVAIIRLADKRMQGYIHQLVLSPHFQSFVISKQTGAGRGGLPKNKMDQIPVAVPPLSEQHRIVARVQELMILCDRLQHMQLETGRCQAQFTASAHHLLSNPAVQDAPHEQTNFLLQNFARLTEHPNQISQLRQSILHLAIRGQLVAQNSNDEAASQFLGALRILPDPDDSFQPLPAGWEWSTLAMLGEVLGGGTPSKGEPGFWGGAIPWVSPKDMKVDAIFDSQDHITELAVAQSAARLIPTGSLLMVVRGMILAHSFPIARTEVPLTINQDMKALVPFHSELISFLTVVLKGLKPQVLKLVERSTHGTCKLLTEDLFSLPIPIPPIAEQARIIGKVSKLMTLCDQLEAELGTVEVHSRGLLDSVLYHTLQ
jgi:type I restriction enzyme, S subunit